MARTLDESFTIDASGNLAVLDGVQALRQKIVRKLKHFRGEWSLDTSSGVPYLQTIFERPITPGLVASILNREIQEEPEVTSLGVVSVDLDPATRGFSYQAQVFHIYGSQPITVEV